MIKIIKPSEIYSKKYYHERPIKQNSIHILEYFFLLPSYFFLLCFFIYHSIEHVDDPENSFFRERIWVRPV